MKGSFIVYLLAASTLAAFSQTEPTDMSGERYQGLGKWQEQGYIQQYANYYSTKYDFKTAVRIRDEFNKREPGAAVSTGIEQAFAWCDNELHALSPAYMSMNEVMHSYMVHAYGAPNLPNAHE
jgi:hypothetical protein